jgi:restriction endonuclease S subunit
MSSKSKTKIVLFSTKEQLKEYVHSIHDFIRNSGGGYSMAAMKLFNMFWSIKLLENKMVDFKLPKECDWSYLRTQINSKTFDTCIYTAINNIRDRAREDFKMKNPLKQFIEDLYDNIDDLLDVNKNKDLQQIRNKIADKLDEINDGNNSDDRIIINNMSYFIYHEITSGLKCDFMKELFELVDALPIGVSDKQTDKEESFDLKGKIYEYFIGRDATAISELGAYFTDRYLTSLCFDIVKPEYKNNIVPKMIDMYGGSGGFTLKYVDYLTKHFNIDWNYKDNYKNVHHYDMSEDVIKIAGVEFYSLTGKFPTKGETFRKMNSFKHEFTDKFKFIFSNPPYGGDKGSETPIMKERREIIEYNQEQLKDIINRLCSNYDISKESDIKKFTNELNKQLDFNKKEQLINELIINGTIDNMDKFKLEMDKLFIDFCKKKKLDYDENKDDYYIYARIVMQNILFKKTNEIDGEIYKKRKVNYLTCSRFIQDYAQDIIHNYNVFTRNETIKRIENELKTEKDEVKINHLNKCKDKCEKELKIKYNKKTTVLGDETGFNDKESCSLVLLMGLLDTDGTCVAVLKEGNFFASNYSVLRCHMVNNFNITHIISIDPKAFENTTTKTSIIIFKNDGNKTKHINFYDIDIDKYIENNHEIDLAHGTKRTEYKDFIKENGVQLKFKCKASYKQLSEIKLTYNKNNEPKFEFDYSFNFKDYMDYKVVCPDGYEIVKLDTLCEIKDGYAFKSSDFKKEGNRLIQISNINNGFINIKDNDIFITPNDKYNKNIAENGNLLLGMTGNIQDKLGYFNSKDICYLNQRVCGFKNFKNNLYKTYFHSYWIYNNLGHKLQKIANGSNQKNLSKETLLNTELPFPTDINKIKKPLDKLYKLHQQITNDTELIPQKEQHIMDLIKKLTSEGKKGVDYDENNFDKLVEYQKKTIKYKATHGKKQGKYKFYTSSQETILFTNDEPLFIDTMLIMGRKGDVSVHYDKQFSCEHDDVYVMKVNDIDTRYLYCYVRLNKEWFKFQMNGSTINGTSKEILSKFIVKVLNPTIMKKHKLEELFDEVDKLKDQLEANKKTYQEQLNELFKDFKDEDDETSNDNIDENYEETEQETVQTVEYKGIKYILEDNIVYKIKEDDSRGSKVGKWVNGKIEKGIKKDKIVDA